MTKALADPLFGQTLLDLYASENTDFDRSSHPYKMEFKNIMFDDPPMPMELKASTAGYQWIGPGRIATHSTDLRHDFDGSQDIVKECFVHDSLFQKSLKEAFDVFSTKETHVL